MEDGSSVVHLGSTRRRIYPIGVSRDLTGRQKTLGLGNKRRNIRIYRISCCVNHFVEKVMAAAIIYYRLVRHMKQ